MRLLHNSDGTHSHFEYSVNEINDILDGTELTVEDNGWIIIISDLDGNNIKIQANGDYAGAHWLDVWANGLRLDVYSDD
jgi:hypothetical protein